MLVLARKVNEKILIGEDIEITIVSVSGDNVRLGIQAPQNIKILRSEVYKEIMEQNREASVSEHDKDKELSAKLIAMLEGKSRGQNN
ncbi:MAG: carbon storage regulator CsrA [Eubacteriales bacterium]